ALRLEALAVGLEAPVKRVELRALLKRLSVSRSGPRVALAFDALGISISLGNNHLALAVGIGADLFAFGEAERAQFVGHALALRLHPTIHRLAYFQGQIHTLEPHVQNLHADLARVSVNLLAHEIHDGFALARDDIVDSALAELRAQIVVDRLREPDA